MLPNIPLIDKIFIEKNDYNDFQYRNIDKIIQNLKKFQKNDFDIIYLEENQIDIMTKEQVKVEYEKESNIKYNLIIQKNKGLYIKKCPGTPNYICCNYFITTFYINCSLNCTYCFLKFYLKNNNLIIYYDIDNFFGELKKFKKLRLGSGELSDSLLFDPITNYSTLIFENLKENNSIIFEFKTKTAYIEPFLNTKPIENIIIGFSMNPNKIATLFEPLANSVEQRFKSAKTLIDKGWKVSFHFDPIILTKENEIDNYLKLFDEISSLPNKSIAWFSLGTLRYHQDMMNHLRKDERGKSLLNYEIIIGLDNKVRYFVEERINIYKKILEIYKRNNCDFPLYYCMESDKVYYSTFGKLPNEIDKLNDIFNFS